MESNAVRLAQLVATNLRDIAPSQRLLVGICGIPASGKSTFAELVANHTNILLASANTTDRAALVGLDGWHLTRAQLDALPDPKLAHDRRGSYWTFDGPSYLSFIQRLRRDTSDEVITAPSFDHALKDPTADGVKIRPIHRIVFIEGLYTCLSVGEWGKAAKVLDERWYIRVDIDQAKQRLVKRHVKTGVTKDLEEAHWRAEQNDMPNGLFIIENMLEPTEIVESLEDPVLTHGTIIVT